MMPSPIEICAACPFRQFTNVGVLACSLTITTEMPAGTTIQEMAASGVCAHPHDFFKNGQTMPKCEPTAVAAPITPTPGDKWPAWVKAVEKLRDESDAGIGDTIHRQLGLLGEAYIVSLSLLGMNCGCERRRADLNIQYPYEKSP